MIFTENHWYLIADQSVYDTLDLSLYQPVILWSTDGTQFIAEYIGTPPDLTGYVDHGEALVQSKLLIDNPEPEDV